MLGLIGKKVGMTSIFSVDGKSLSCSVVEVGPCVVIQVKTIEKDGYAAFQLGFGNKKEKHTTKAEQGHFKKAGVTPKKCLVEFKGQANYKQGDTITVDFFRNVMYVDVSGISKGKGFQGVVKRHRFKGVGQSTLGQSDRQRHPGSIGACSYPAKVFKGTRMAGQMGNKKITVQNLKIIKVVAERNLLLLEGAVPGANGSIVIIRK